MKTKSKIILIGILILAYVLRVFGIDWDSGFNLHPDERAIIMFTLDLQMPETWSEFLSPQSPLNPNFFAYGNFPLYLLKLVSTAAAWIDPSFGSYDRIAIVGRIISAVADIGTFLIIYFLAKRIFTVRVGILATLFYSLSVFPIQTSHFYAVDILLSLFITLTLYFFVLIYEQKGLKYAILSGFSLGLATATKISAIVLIIPFGILLLMMSLKMYRTHKKQLHVSHFLKVFRTILVVPIVAILVFGITQPYVLIDFKSFIEQTQHQSLMTKDVFTFPYTMQYYGKIPYVYEIKNVFLWGLGPVISLIAIYGLFLMKNILLKKFYVLSILLSFYLSYFLIVGSFAVGWMRYMLPLYPFFAICAGYGFYTVIRDIKKYKKLRIVVLLLSIIAIAFWPISFMQIYMRQHPRIVASNWITQTIPPGSTIATEHWDDRLPLTHSDQYTYHELPLYHEDTPDKWQTINSQLASTDYIILASNRLYTPLQKLTDCDSLPPTRCYPYTAEYYRKLFSGELGFEKVAEFTSYPTVPFTNISINDQTADESFTVYDHPKVLIFQKRY